MDIHRKELAHRLFVQTTEIAEAAHETAMSGQAATAQPAQLVIAAKALCRRGEELTAIGRSVSIAVEIDAPASPTDVS